MSFLVCTELTRVFHKGDREIRPLDGLNLTLEAGAFAALMGPSGSGKTTLLNLIAGIDRATSGSLEIDGQDLARMSRSKLATWRSRNVGYVFQLYNLVPVLDAFENVELPLLLHPLGRSQRRERVLETLERVGIADRADHYPRQLSGGQEQRVAIARALVTRPRLLVADEPTGDLDGPSAEAIMNLLVTLNRDTGQTVVMVTHDPGAAAHATTQLHLSAGKIAEPQLAGAAS